MRKPCKEFKQEMKQSYKNHHQILENELRKTSKQDSKTFWKIFANWIYNPYKPRIWYYLRAEDQVE
jgi:hypothetical protein